MRPFGCVRAVRAPGLATGGTRLTRSAGERPTARVVVAGSINMDIVAIAGAHPLAGETVLGSELAFHPGGKGANQAVAAARAGAEARMIGRVGDDAFGRELEAFLAANGVGVASVVREPGAASGAALIVVDAAGENRIVVVPGANAMLSPEDVAGAELRPGDVAVAQLEIPSETVEAFFGHAREAGATTVLNPSPAGACPPNLLGLADLIVLNRVELATLAASDPTGDVEGPARSLGAAVVVTLGSDGVVAFADGATYRYDGRRAAVVDTTGAGDVFVGALAASLSRGERIDQALPFANAAAALSVQRPGAGPAIPTRREIEVELLQIS
jgi:ribokinase